MKLRIKVDGRTKSETSGISLEVQWLTLCTSSEGDTGSIPGQGTKIPRAAQWGLKKKKWDWGRPWWSSVSLVRELGSALGVDKKLKNKINEIGFENEMSEKG